MTAGRERERAWWSWPLAVLPTLGGGGISFTADARERQMLFIFNETNSSSEVYSLFIYSCLFIPSQLGASQLHTNTTGETLATMCICATARGTGHQRGNGAVWSKIWGKCLSNTGNIVRNYVGAREKKDKQSEHVARWLALWDCMWILLSRQWLHSEAWLVHE